MAWGGPYKIEVIRDFVPEKVKPWILLAFLLVFQFSGGVYMGAATHMADSLSLLHEDVMMAGFASLVGLCLTFTVMYRLKSCFTIKTGILTSGIGLVICNLICLNTTNVPLLVATSLIAGIFKMWGTFMCNTTLAPWLFPKWTMAKFQSFVQVIVMGSVLLSGLTTIYISYYIKWQYMHWFITGVIMLMLIFTLMLFRHHRIAKKLPLYGIDWMGAILLSITTICLIFVLNYGDHYDWFQSVYIRMGAVFGILALGLNIWRASFIRHPFISNKTWLFRNFRIAVFILIIISFLTSPSNSIEQMYTVVLLKYDSLNRISLNWIALLGYIFGSLFSFFTLALRDWKYRTMTLIAFSMILGYLLVMYFIVDYNLPKEALYFPVFLRSTGSIIIAITFLAAIFRTVPFQFFFQALNLMTLFSACFGPLLGSAVLTHIFKITMKKNALLLSANIDKVNPIARQIPPESLFDSLQHQAMIVSMKEIYGWLCMVGIFCILAFLLNESSLHPQTIHSKILSLKRTKKYELKLDKLHRE